MKIQARVKEAGILTIGTGPGGVDRNGNDISGALALYEHDNSYDLYVTAKSYPVIIRPNGRRENGTEYTARKTYNDFKKYAQ